MEKDITEQFFKVFGIEAKAKSKEVRDGLIECGLYYPEITDRIALELVCVLSRYNMGIFDHIGAITMKPYEIYVCNIKELKEKILQDAIIKMQELENVEWQSLFKQEIQQLFKGEE